MTVNVIEQIKTQNAARAKFIDDIAEQVGNTFVRQIAIRAFDAGWTASKVASHAEALKRPWHYCPACTTRSTCHLAQTCIRED